MYIPKKANFGQLPGWCFDAFAIFRPSFPGEEGLNQGYCGQMGHECSGTVRALGERVSHLQVGDRVAMEPGVPCDMAKENAGGARDSAHTSNMYVYMYISIHN